MFVVFAASMAILWAVARGARFEASVPWIEMKGIVIEVGFLIDPLSALMLVIVSFVSLLVQVYSLGYMADEERFRWYYGAISLFTAAMLGVVTLQRLAPHVPVLGGHGARVVSAHRLLVSRPRPPPRPRPRRSW